MHTQNFDYTSEDIEYSTVAGVADALAIPRSIYFHYNSDMSGEVLIVAHDDDGEQRVVHVPGWMILEFVGRHCASEAISTIEGYSGQDFLKRMVT